MDDQSYWDWVKSGSGWFGTWNEDGGWTSDHLGTWVGEGVQQGADTVDAVRKASPTVDNAIKRIEDIPTNLTSAASTAVTVVELVAGAAILWSLSKLVRG